MKQDELRAALRLYAVTDRAWLNGRDLAAQVEEAILGGVTMVQLREKDLSPAEFLAEAQRVRQVCARHRVPFLINDNVEIALACGAQGVHIGQKDMDARQARKLLGTRILGVSARTVEEALAAQAAGADYLGVGAVFPTSTKPDADSVSYDTLRAIRAAVKIPIAAIGGITPENLRALNVSGADGAAVVSALFAAKDIRAAAARLYELSGVLSPAPLRFSGAIFDMDGTLTDSMPLWQNTGERFLAARGLTLPDGAMEDLKPLSMVQTARYLRERFSLPDTEQAIMDELNSLVEKGYCETAPVKRDILPFLEKLRKAGVAMCVATATDRYLAEAILRRTGIWDCFQFLLTCTELGAGKDNPAVFERALEKLGTAKDDTIVFEDALHAVQTAKSAGFRVVAIQDDSCREDAAEIRKTADRYIYQYEEVILA